MRCSLGKNFVNHSWSFGLTWKWRDRNWLRAHDRCAAGHLTGCETLARQVRSGTNRTTGTRSQETERGSKVFSSPQVLVYTRNILGLYDIFIFFPLLNQGAVHFSPLFVLSEGWARYDLSALTPRDFNDLT